LYFPDFRKYGIRERQAARNAPDIRLGRWRERALLLAAGQSDVKNIAAGKFILCCRFT
jgi:hypothetical protein